MRFPRILEIEGVADYLGSMGLVAFAVAFVAEQAFACWVFVKLVKEVFK